MRVSNLVAALHNSTALVKQQQEAGASTHHKQVSAASRISLGQQAAQADSYEGVLQGEILRAQQQGRSADSRARVLHGEAFNLQPTNPAASRRAIDQFLQAQPATNAESESPRRHIDVYA